MVMEMDEKREGKEGCESPKKVREKSDSIRKNRTQSGKIGQIGGEDYSGERNRSSNTSRIFSARILLWIGFRRKPLMPKARASSSVI